MNLAHNSLWTDGTIRRPVSEYLDASEMRKLFGISEETLRNFIDAGVIPEPTELTAKTKLFTWRHAVVLALRIEMNWIPSVSEVAKTVAGSKEK